MSRVSGLTVGAVVAIVVITTIAILGIYQIMRAYTAAYRALTEYTVQVQKPEFRFESITLFNATHVLITLVNDGPVGARVGRVHVYVYDPTTGVPSTTDEFHVNRFVPVGGRVEIYVRTDSLLGYIVGGRPVRATVETDKGPVLTSIPVAKGTLRLNVIIPSYGVNVGQPRIIITCPPQANMPYFHYVVEPPSIMPPGFTFFTDGRLLSISGEIPALAPCLVDFSAQVSNIRVVSTMWNGTRAAEFATASRQVRYKALADIRPGSVTSVEISIPELLTDVKNVPVEQVGATVIDFSWYFVSYRTDLPAKTVPSSGETHFGDTEYGVYPHPYNLTRMLLMNGVIEATSPIGCIIYPLASPTPPPGLMDVWDWYEYTTTEPPLFRGDPGMAFHPGPVVLVPNPFEAGNCASTPQTGSVILRVSVPFTLGAGRYLVIPVFTYDDRDDNNKLMVTVRVTITNPQGVSMAQDDVHEDGSYPGPTQIAQPFIVNSDGSGVWRANINVIYRSGSWTKYIKVIVSKVVIIPIVGSPMFCTFDATGEPVYPFADVHLSNGTVVRNAPILARVEARTLDTDNPYLAEQIMNNLIFWRNHPERPRKDVVVRIEGQSGGGCRVRVGTTDITNMVRAPTFCSPGTSVVISYADPNNNEGVATLIPYVDSLANPYTLAIARNTLLYGALRWSPTIDGYFVSYTEIEEPMLGILVAKHRAGSPYLQISITAPSSGNWIALVPFALHIPTPRTSYPEISVNTSTGWHNTVYQHHTLNILRGVIYVVFSGSNVTVTIYLPAPEQPYGITCFFVHYVVLAPNFSGMPIAQPVLSKEPTVTTGIRVFGVAPVISSDPIYFRLVRKSDTKVLGLWRYTPQGTGAVNVLLPVNGIFRDLKYDAVSLWNKELIERVPPDDYLLIVQNARCPG